MRYLQNNARTAKVKLDAKDRKLLSMHAANSRTPLTQLSRHVQLSRDAVSYRIKRYEKDGLIQGYRTMVDLSQLGYHAHHVFIRLDNPAPDMEHTIVDKLVKHQSVREVIKFSGNYDFEIAFVARDTQDLDRVLTDILAACADSLQDYEVLTIARTFAAETFPPNFSVRPPKHAADLHPHTADQKDIEILKVIGDNARLPLHAIAGKVNLSADAVNYRIKSMMRSGLIVRFFPVINYAALGYNLHTLLLSIVLDGEKEGRLRSFLSASRNTLWAVKTVGSYNVLIYLIVTSIDELQETVMKLRSLFPKQIRRYEALIAYEEYKFVYFPKGLL